MQLWSNNESDTLYKKIDIDTSTYDEKINTIKNKIETLKIKHLSAKKEYELYKQNKIILEKYRDENEYCENTKKQIDNINSKIYKSTYDIHECKRILKEIEFYDKYVVYAKENNLIEYTSDNTKLRKLIGKCNKHRQKFLLEKSNDGLGWFSDEVYSRCLDVDSDSDDGENKENSCKGWYYNSYRCTCGNYKGWIWTSNKEDVKDVLQFSIESDRPDGYADHC
ncbi:MAG: hypothetical protein O7C59_11785 [Rickettsia endosymbiont of Ixodes persulcatus]|nr:hypothetical protein [Rickettsia endosymbiont of Ixodes persulcatus]